MVLAVILLAMPITLYHTTSVPIPKNPLGAISGFETIQLTPDPNLALSPNVTIERSSGEFSVDHHISTGGMDFNYVLLNWAHAAGTELSWPVIPHLSTEMPECNDFIYFTQTFHWEREILPTDVNVTFELGVELLGDFATSEEGGLMFKVYIWLIDSSGNWRQVYRTSPPYIATQQVQHTNLNYFDIVEGWGGMIEDEDGVQEDPDDNLTIAVGLAPTAWFLEIFEAEPWREYDGSVTASISRLELTVILETEASPRLHPRSNNTLSSRYMDICEDVCVASDGAVYTVGTKSHYPTVNALMLAKWDSQANLQWVQMWNGSTFASGYGVAESEGFVYTVGIDWSGLQGGDLVILKWDPSGGLAWQESFDNNGQDYGRKIAIGEDGVTYVVGDTWSSRYLTSSAFLAKFDSEGNRLWFREISGFPYWSWDQGLDVAVTDEGNVYAMTSHYLTLWNADGDLQWTVSTVYNDLAIGPDCSAYLVGQIHSDNMQLDKVNETGELDWSVIKNVSYGYLKESLSGVSVAVAPNGSIYVVAESCRYDLAYLLVKYDTEGQEIWNRTIGENNWAHGYGMCRTCHLAAPGNGLLYLATTILTEGIEADFALAIYEIGATGWSLGLDAMSITLYSTASMLIMIVIIDYARRRRRWHSGGNSM